jgi:hypothetical protein
VNIDGIHIVNDKKNKVGPPNTSPSHPSIIILLELAPSTTPPNSAPLPASCAYTQLKISLGYDELMYNSYTDDNGDACFLIEHTQVPPTATPSEVSASDATARIVVWTKQVCPFPGCASCL